MLVYLAIGFNMQHPSQQPLSLNNAPSFMVGLVNAVPLRCFAALRGPDTSRSSSEVEAEVEEAEEPQQVEEADNKRSLASRDDMSCHSRGFGMGSAGSAHSRVPPVGHCSNMLNNGV